MRKLVFFFTLLAFNSFGQFDITRKTANLDSINARTDTVNINSPVRGQFSNWTQILKGDTTLKDYILFYAASPSLSFGIDNQIPFMNAAGSDFEYSSNFAWDDTRLTVLKTTNTYIGNNNTASSISGLAGSNIVIGLDAASSGTGNANTIIGVGAADLGTLGTNNVLLGYNSGSNLSGTGNIFIGANSGESETTSNKLYIENSNSATPLIYGEFDNDKLIFNADTSTFVGHVKVDSNLYVRGRSILAHYESASYLDPDSTITTSVSTSWTFLGSGGSNKFTNLFSEGFSFDGDTLQFNKVATDTRDSIEFKFSAHANTSASDVNKTVRYSVFVKHLGESAYTQVRQTTSEARTSGAGIYISGPTCTTIPLYLHDGDKIQIRARIASGTTTISTKSAKIYLREE